MIKELTKIDFWEDFWRNLQLPSLVNERNTFDKVFIDLFINELNDNESVYEIGCAPGKWLIYIHQQFNSTVGGCEYVFEAYNKTKENLAINNIDNSQIYHSDINYINTDLKYDVVYSLGFIEHFSDPEPIIRKHIELLQPKGKLIITVPNFKGLHGILLKVQDFFSKGEKILPKHNTSIMNIKYFEKVGSGNNLKIKYVVYMGEFEGAFFAPDQLHSFGKVVLKLLIKISRRISKSVWNKSLTSSFIAAVYEKK